jgi:hypothetical protein
MSDEETIEVLAVTDDAGNRYAVPLDHLEQYRVNDGALDDVEGFAARVVATGGGGDGVLGTPTATVTRVPKAPTVWVAPLPQISLGL